MRADHDTGYKQLFSHPEMMRDLLRAFIPQAWAGALDVSAFERVNASYVGGAGAQRHDDMVWRLRVGGECVYVYLLLEFQSRDDRWMALRMQVYVGLLYQDLVKQRRLGTRGKLPPVLPIVLYGGVRPWRASRALSALALAPPEGLEWLQPEQQYLLIDQGRSGASDAGKNLVAALFSLQRTRSREASFEVVKTLIGWLWEEQSQLLRDSLLSWISRCLRHKLYREDGIGRKEFAMKPDIEDKQFDSWEEALIDLLVNGQDLWRRAAREEGMEKGREEEARALLRRLLSRHGEALKPEWALAIDQAGQAELEGWLERLYDGASPPELFAPPARAT
jgi:hypothetical protein